MQLNNKGCVPAKSLILTFPKEEIFANDNDVYFVMGADNLDYLDVLARIEQWICNEIVFCYMNGTDRDLSIEIKGNGKGMMAI